MKLDNTCHRKKPKKDEISRIFWELIQREWGSSKYEKGIDKNY